MDLGKLGKDSGRGEALRKSSLGEKLAKQVPLGFGKVEQIVPVVLFLSSSSSRAKVRMVKPPPEGEIWPP